MQGDRQLWRLLITTRLVPLVDQTHVAHPIVERRLEARFVVVHATPRRELVPLVRTLRGLPGEKVLAPQRRRELVRAGQVFEAGQGRTEVAVPEAAIFVDGHRIRRTAAL